MKDYYRYKDYNKIYDTVRNIKMKMIQAGKYCALRKMKEWLWRTN